MMDNPCRFKKNDIRPRIWGQGVLGNFFDHCHAYIQALGNQGL